MVVSHREMARRQHSGIDDSTGFMRHSTPAGAYLPWLTETNPGWFVGEAK